MRQVNTLNLKKALNEILKKVNNNEPMYFTTLCKDCNLGQTSTNRLKYALLEHKYYVPKADKPLSKMKVNKDGETWSFIFKSSTGSRQWNFIEEDFDIIKEAMEVCPPEQADPTYYKNKASKQEIVEEPQRIIEEEIHYPLESFTIEDMCTEIKRRGFNITLTI